MALPEKFLERMKEQIPETEWEDFLSSYDRPFEKGVRLNVLKGDRDALKEKLSFLSEPIPWEENGFYTDREKLGASVWHFAGLFYSQEPSAMSAAPLLEVKRGEKVLDLCSAPGGKGTQLAAAMQGEGVLVLNEPILQRAKILSQNVERLGVKNAVVTNAFPEELAEKFCGYFDKILVDSPCSGEGMFKKNADAALNEWSVENVLLCAKRQKLILDCATKMLKNGGRLVYSTCTFSKEEDEGQVFDYLQNHTEMRLVKQKKLYPHKVRGEGHFVAVFEKTTGEVNELRLQKRSISSDAEKLYRAFEKKFFNVPFACRLHEQNGVLYELPEDVFDLKGLHVLRAGVKLGEVINGRFEPSHSLATCVKTETCKAVAELSEEESEKYLRGETIEKEIENGWCLMCAGGYPLGLGKAVNGTIKNHYPKGLRKLG